MGETTMVRLTDNELLLLDRRCSDEVQSAVDAAKQRIDFRALHPDASATDAGLIADAVRIARDKGRLTWVYADSSSCRTCDRVRTYAKLRRTSRKGRRGDVDYDRPIYVRSVELDARSLVIRGHVSLGCCLECLERIRPPLVAALDGVRAELPEKLTGSPPRFRRYERRHCTRCGWSGHEGEMRLLPAIISGLYRGGCPCCDAKNTAFGARPVESVEGFDVVEVEGEAA